jgi:hypothetical protein
MLPVGTVKFMGAVVGTANPQLPNVVRLGACLRDGVCGTRRNISYRSGSFTLVL